MFLYIIIVLLIWIWIKNKLIFFFFYCRMLVKIKMNDKKNLYVIDEKEKEWKCCQDKLYFFLFLFILENIIIFN